MIDCIRTKRLRSFQRNRCYLCGQPFLTPYPPGTPNRRRMNREGFPTIDHVFPRAMGYGLHRNKLLAHAKCNALKGDRRPFVCEVLYLEAVMERADAKRAAAEQTRRASKSRRSATGSAAACGTESCGIVAA